MRSTWLNSSICCFVYLENPLLGKHSPSQMDTYFGMNEWMKERMCPWHILVDEAVPHETKPSQMAYHFFERTASRSTWYLNDNCQIVFQSVLPKAYQFFYTNTRQRFICRRKGGWYCWEATCPFACEISRETLKFQVSIKIIRTKERFNLPFVVFLSLSPSLCLSRCFVPSSMGMGMEIALKRK